MNPGRILTVALGYVPLLYFGLPVYALGVAGGVLVADRGWRAYIALGVALFLLAAALQTL